MRRFTLALAALTSTAAVADEDGAAALSVELARLESEPASADGLAAQARVLHYLAERSKDGKALHEKGLAKAEAALALDDRNPGGLLWWATHRGSQATPLDPISALRIAKEVERKLVRLRTVAPAHEHGAADRILSHLYRVAPSGISVGSMSKARRHAEAALAIDGVYPGNRLLSAQLLDAEGDDCGAAKAARSVLADEAGLAAFPLDRAGWVRIATELSKEDCP